MAANAEEAEHFGMIAKLRQRGIQRHHDMPQIIVCGYQSTGKSSVLQAITNIPFPRSKSTCTRFITEVSTRRSTEPVQRIEVRIRAASDSEPRRAQYLETFVRTGEETQCLGRILQEAEKAIRDGISDDSKPITQDVVQVTVSGPGQKELQLVDLPGLFGYVKDHEEREEAKTIMKRYMAMQHSLILAVVRANGDSNGAETDILNLCRLHDPDGKRTMGVVTHPDKSDGQELQWIPKLKIQSIKGSVPEEKWHVVRNFDDDKSPGERFRDEEDFFRTGPWNDVSDEFRGSRCLMKRLEGWLVLKQKETLPAMREDLRRQLKRLNEKLHKLSNKLGHSSDDERVGLFREKLDELRKGAMDHARGKYEYKIQDSFDGPHVAFLRSRIVDEGECLRDSIMKYGHTWKSFISPLETGLSKDLRFLNPSSSEMTKPKPVEWQEQQKTFADEDNEVQEMTNELFHKRGLEVFWQANPDRIHGFFWRMSKPWHEISIWHAQESLRFCEQYVAEVVPTYFSKGVPRVHSMGFANSDVIGQRYIERHVLGNLEKRWKRVKQELQWCEGTLLTTADDRRLQPPRGLVRLRRRCEGYIRSLGEPLPLGKRQVSDVPYTYTYELTIYLLRTALLGDLFTLPISTLDKWMEDDRQGPIINYELSFFEKQREMSLQQNFNSTARAVRVLNDWEQNDTAPFNSLQHRGVGVASKQHAPEDHFNREACEFINAAVKHYEAMVERHILKEFERVFPTSLSDEEVLSLTKGDPEIEQERVYTEKERDDIKALLGILEKSLARK
ncbi:hypothetical protein ACHAQA_004181 [Verticillium albo-atrum]